MRLLNPMRRNWLAAALLGTCALSGVSAALPGEVSLQLWVRGGPAAGDIVVGLNGDPLATLGASSEPYIELEDKLRAGINEMTIQLVAPEEPRSASRMQLLVAPVEELSESRSKATTAVAMVDIPESATPSACTETILLWHGDMPPPPSLKKTYYLAVSGAPAAHRVTVHVNERPVLSTNVPVPLMTVSPLFTAGKNTVSFDTQPACFVESGGSDQPLSFVVSSGEIKGEKVQIDHPMANFVVQPGKTPKALEKTIRVK